MALRKGKLRNNDGVVDSSGYMPRLSMQGSRDIIETKEESWWSIFGGWVKGIFAFILCTIVIVGLVYSGLAGTSLMMFAATSSDSSERSIVVRNAWMDKGNEPPIGETVVISTNSHAPTEWWNNIKVGWTGIPAPAQVEVLTDNYEKLYIDNSTVVSFDAPGETFEPFVASPAYKYDLKEKPVANHQMDGQYLVKCVSGDCDKDSYFVIDEEQIFGKTYKNE